jgi:hypothetical protein
MPPDPVIVAHAYPAKLVLAFETCGELVRIVHYPAGSGAGLTCHVVAAVVLLDVVDAIIPGALLCEFANLCDVGGLLGLLVTLFAA